MKVCCGIILFATDFARVFSLYIRFLFAIHKEPKRHDGVVVRDRALKSEYRESRIPAAPSLLFAAECNGSQKCVTRFHFARIRIQIKLTRQTKRRRDRDVSHILYISRNFHDEWMYSVTQ